jgi:hypothetical protein
MHNNSFATFASSTITKAHIEKTIRRKDKVMEREPPNMSILQKKKTLGEEKKTTPHPKLLIVKFLC